MFVVFCSTIGDSKSIMFKKPKQFCLEQTSGGSLFVWTRSDQRVRNMELKSDPFGISTKALMELLELEIFILPISSCLLKIPSLLYYEKLILSPTSSKSYQPLGYACEI